MEILLGAIALAPPLIRFVGLNEFIYRNIQYNIKYIDVLFHKDKKLQSFVITRRQQKDLFKITYRNEAKEAKRLVTKYYKINWQPLRKKIKEILVDLKYRGDFRPKRSTQAMKKLKNAVKKNSLADLKNVMGSRALWRNVPYDRFLRRKNYLK